MPIPTYDALMLPVLRLCAEKLWTMRDLVSRVADELRLSPEERAQRHPSGGSTVIACRVHWAKTYLKQAGLLEQPKRAIVGITLRGRELLRSNPTNIDIATLQQFSEFKSFMGRVEPAAGSAVAQAATQTRTPEELIDSASGDLDEALRDALLTRILESSPSFFEKMILDLLLAMGYGGSRAAAGKQLGGTGDGGVDGVIHEDQLGLDRVYLQAKRYKPGNTVGAEAVQAFIGALVGKRASKGVLMTTSSFSKAALSAADNSGSLRLVLIDGDALTKLMLRHNVGVRVARTVEIKRVDLDYFEDGDAE